jgi:DNA polymerase III epsilon subunit-like protein
MSIEFYIADTETTGTCSKNNWHEITQISIIRCADRVQLNKYIKPEHPERTNYQALAYTGRTMKDLEKGDDKKIVVDFCNDFFSKDGKTPEERCIIGHNIISFDKRFLHALWEELGYTFPANLWLDTLPYVRDFAKKRGLDEKKFNLERALEIVGAKPRPGAHNAIVDTQNNYILWDKLKKEGISALPHMKRFAHSIGDADDQ